MRIASAHRPARISARAASTRARVCLKAASTTTVEFETIFSVVSTPRASSHDAVARSRDAHDRALDARETPRTSRETPSRDEGDEMVSDRAAPNRRRRHLARRASREASWTRRGASRGVCTRRGVVVVGRWGRR